MSGTGKQQSGRQQENGRGHVLAKGRSQGGEADKGTPCEQARDGVGKGRNQLGVQASVSSSP